MGTTPSRNAEMLGLATAAAASGYLIGWLQFERANQRRERIENQMQLVGRVSELFIYPLKSCRPIVVPEAHCGAFGLTNGSIKDRVFVVTDENHHFLTGRQEGRLLLIQPSYHDDELWLDAPETDTFKLKIPDAKQKSAAVKIFGQKTRGIDCGNEVAKWLCKVLGRKDGSAYLFYHPWETNERDPGKDAIGWELYDTKKDTCIYADLCSFMLINESSLEELNSRLDKKVSVRNFRPNILINGPEAFDEDKWKYVKIGSRATFRCIRPCARCVMTTIDPDTGMRSREGDPLKTLKKYRQFDDPEQRKRDGESPRFGEYLGMDVGGVIRVGDPIYAAG